MSTSKRRQRRGKPGDLQALKRELWFAVVTAGDMLEHHDPELRLRAVHGVSQSAGAYARLLDSGEIEERLKRLEDRAEELRRAAAKDDLPIFGEERNNNE